MLDQDYLSSALEPFYVEGWISEVLYVVKSGKEATVYCCQAGPTKDVDYLAVKVYRSRENRTFKNDAVYREGRVIRDKHLRRAFENKSRRGKEFQFDSWLNYEFETLTLLSTAGADIPRPIARSGRAILMEYVGGYQQPAPVLNNVLLESGEARIIFDLLMRNIALWLACNRVHGDLSAFNVLYWDGVVKVIDFPQAIDPRFNPNAFSLLERDIDHIYRYLARYGVVAEPARLARELWAKFMDAEL